ncbi:hypothetical protein [Streptomyces sp. NBC_01589]|uniref:hypothetical protein n=1 Tax=unclassified Streptomyces TaxID=2593676 RepID=UPI0038668086
MTAIGAVVVVVATIWGLFLGIRSTDASEKGSTPDQKAEARDQSEKDEEDAKEAGPPIQSAAGYPNFYSSRYAFPERTLELGEGEGALYGTAAYTNWFTKNRAVEVGAGAVRVTLSPLHKGTVVIQNMRLTNLKCQPTKYAGTAVVPPAIGDGGDEVVPVNIAFDLTEPVPRPRINAGRVISESADSDEVWQIKGNAFSKEFYLDGGDQADARSFDLFFFTGKKDCNFGVEVNVTSGSKNGWFPITLGDDSTYEVAGQAERYESVVLPSNTGDEAAVQNVLHGPGNPFTPIRLQKSQF